MLELGISWVRGVENATHRANESLREKLSNLVSGISFDPLWCREGEGYVEGFKLYLIHPTEIEHPIELADNLRFVITFQDRQRHTILVKGIVLRQELACPGNGQTDLMAYVLFSDKLKRAFSVGAEYTDLHILHPSLFGGARGQVTGFIPDQMPFATHAAMVM